MSASAAHAIQPATACHASLLASIHASAFPPHERWGRDALALTLDIPGTFSLFSPSGGMVLARVAADQAEILMLAVAPEARRQGCGLALLRAAEVLALRAGAEAMFLEVSAANAPALSLYRTAEYKEVARRPRYYRDGSDALVLLRKLRQHAAAAG